jgi:hypothetical protein
VVVTKGPNQLEDRESGLVADNDLAIDQARARRQHRNRCHDLRKSLAEVVAVAGVEPHALGVAPRHDAEAVVLDLVQPVGAARRGLGRRRQAEFDEADYSTATL